MEFPRLATSQCCPHIPAAAAADTSSITSCHLSADTQPPSTTGDEDSVTDSNYGSGPPTDTLSDTSGSSRGGGGHRALPRHPAPAAAAVKPALIKKKRKNHKPHKSVTFSDSVCLIAAVDEQQDETDYMAYVSNLINNTRKAKESKRESMVKTRSQTPLSLEKDGAKTGYDSDFDENTSDSCTSDEVQGDKVRCNLCRKKLIEVNEIYCIDCTHYMAKFQPSSS